MHCKLQKQALSYETLAYFNISYSIDDFYRFYRAACNADAVL